MINDKIFKAQLEEKLMECFGDGISVTWHDVTRNNGEVTTGLQIDSGENTVPAIISMDKLYEQYKAGGLPISMIAEKICASDQQFEKLEESQLPKLLDFERIQNRILYKLVNKELNEGLLSEVPHREFLDLAVVYYILVREDETERMTVLIYNEMLEKWGISEEELYHQAARNTPAMQPIMFKKATDIIKEVAPDDYKEALEIEEETMLPLYLLTNRQNLYGATVLLYPILLKSISALLDSDLLILPSSIHDTLVVPFNESTDFRKFKKMVQGVNLMCIHKEDVLSDYVYYYQRESGKLSAK